MADAPVCRNTPAAAAEPDTMAAARPVRGGRLEASRMSTRRAALLAALVPLTLGPLALGTPALATHPVPSPAPGNRIAYTVDADDDGAYALVVTDLESRRTTTVLPADPNLGFTYDDPELSPDGYRIALASDYLGSRTTPPSGPPGIIVVEDNGTGYRRLSTPPSDATAGTTSIDIAPAWSPDGSTILFTRVSQDATGAITSALYTVPANGGTPTTVPGADGGFTADWNPTDGRQIVYAALGTAGTGVGPLTVINLDGTGKRALGPTGALPAWSPDGTTIAYAAVTDPSSTAGDVAQIATVPAAGGPGTVFASTRPTAARTVAEYPSWAPDGQSILYDFYGYDAAGVEQPGDLWAVDRAGVRAGTLLGGRGDEAQVAIHGPAPSDVVAGQPSRFTPVVPQRVLDTREGIGAGKARVQPKTPLTLRLRGVPTSAGPVPDTATAVVLNVTVADVAGATDVRVYPPDAPLPAVSNVNAAVGQTVPNLVTVRLSSSGLVAAYSSGGPVNLVADLAGWYAPGSGGGFTAVDPRRILDTRSPSVGAPTGKVAADRPLDLQVTGALPTSDGDTVTVPDDATAVVLNVTAARATANTDVRVYPTPADPAATPPLVSNLNLRPGPATPNLVTVSVGAGGKVRLLNRNGAVDLIADLAGYYTAGGPGEFVPVVPLRFLDTRSAVGAAPIVTGPDQYLDLAVAGARGVPAGALAAVVNLTATAVTGPTDVRAFPTPTGPGAPLVSNLNVVKGVTRANLAIVKPGDGGRVRLLNRNATVHLIGDLAGYFR